MKLFARLALLAGLILAGLAMAAWAVKRQD